MTLANIVRQKLSETAAASERHELTLTDAASGWSVYLTADRRDAWTAVAWEMALRRSANEGSVDSWAMHITQRVSGLLEPLRVVEVDAAQRKALLRSGPPAERDGKIFYYEVTLEGTSSALVRRFEGSHTAVKRSQIPFALTNEVLAQFIGDLAAPLAA